MNRDQLPGSSRVRVARGLSLCIALAVASGCTQEQTKASGQPLAQEPAKSQAAAQPKLAGFYLTHSVALDDPRWRIEDLACRGSCSLGGFKHLQELLADPKNSERSIKDLLKDVSAFSKQESVALMKDE